MNRLFHEIARDQAARAVRRYGLGTDHYDDLYQIGLEHLLKSNKTNPAVLSLEARSGIFLYLKKNYWKHYWEMPHEEFTIDDAPGPERKEYPEIDSPFINERERWMLRQLIMGYTNQEIAERLGCTHTYVSKAVLTALARHEAGKRPNKPRRPEIPQSDLGPTEKVKHLQDVKRQKPGTAGSKFKGVWYQAPGHDRKKETWRAGLRSAAVNQHIGVFTSAEDAATAYNFYVAENHPGAYLNSVPQPWLEEVI